MPSTIDIINVALRRVGAKRIQSLGEDSAEAAVTGDLIDNVIDDLLRRHIWNFATRRAKLARLTEVPTFEFQYAYGFPADWMRTVSVHPDDAGRGNMFYREEYIDSQRVLLAGVEDVYMRYVAKVIDPNLWPPDFRQAVSMVLAKDLAMPLANSNALYDRLLVESRGAVARAQSSDAMGSSPERMPRNSWTRRRGRLRPRATLFE